MKISPVLVGDMLRFAVAAVFITMTMAFVGVPYVLSGHSLEKPALLATVGTQHLT